MAELLKPGPAIPHSTGRCKVWLCDILISPHVQGPVKADVEIPFEEVLEKAKAGDPKAQTEVRTSGENLRM